MKLLIRTKNNKYQMVEGVSQTIDNLEKVVEFTKIPKIMLDEVTVLYDDGLIWGQII